MPAPDQTVIERQFYLSVLGWSSDNPNLSIEDLRQRVLEAKTIKALDKNIRYENPLEPLVSTLQAAGLGSTTATDNGDGGVTLATVPSAFKFPKYSYAEATYFKIANAVQLAVNPPQPLGATASAGVTQRAAREDHIHLMPPAKPVATITPGSGSNGWLTKPNGNGTTSVNRAHSYAVWISTINRAPLSVTAFGVYVTTAAGAGGTVRFCLTRIQSNGNADYGNKVFESGEISTTTTGFKMASFTGSLPEGIYWWGVVMHTAACNLMNTQDVLPMHHIFNPQDSAPVYFVDGQTGAFPSSGSLGTPGGDITPCLYYTAA